MLNEEIQMVDQMIRQMQAEKNDQGLIDMIRIEIMNYKKFEKQGYRTGPVSPHQFVTSAEFIAEMENNPIHRCEHVIPQAIQALTELNSDKVSKMLSELVSMQLIWIDLNIGQSVLQALVAKAGAKAVPFIKPLLKTRYPNAREAAAAALAELEGEKAKRPLLKAIKREKNDLVKYTMLAALDTIDHEAAREQWKIVDKQRAKAKRR